MSINITILKDYVYYDPDTGVFVWAKSTPGHVQKGRRAGHVRKDGYRGICIRGNYYLEHRLVWLYVYGELPSINIDHINRVRDDNRISNLRLATQSENMQNRGVGINSSTRCPGVTYIAKEHKYKAYISVHGKKQHLGTFELKEDAMAARKAAEEIYHPYRTN